MKDFAAIGSGLVLPLPRFVFHPLTAVTIAAIHIYLSLGHLSELVAGQVQWVHIWKGFGAIFGAYVFAALATRGMLARRHQATAVAHHLKHPEGLPILDTQSNCAKKLINWVRVPSSLEDLH